MKRPKTPPNLDDIWQQIRTNSQKVANMLNMASQPIADNKYLHWDRLRYYSPPERLSHEDWWFTIKKQRQLLLKDLPLLDSGLKPFRFLMTDSIFGSVHKVDIHNANFTQTPIQIKNAETKNRYYVNALIQEAFTSSQLEGATTTRLVAKEMIRTGRPPQDKSEQMILNNFAAMKRIEKLKDEPLSQELVLELHRLVTEKTLNKPSASGRFRNSNERIVVGDMYNEVFHDPPLAEQLEERVSTMCDFANGKTPDYFIHPVIRSIILHFWLAYDHPFVDGNGRTARALFYWLMLRNRYWIFEFVSISQIIVEAPVKYGRSFLYTETDDNDLTYFIIYNIEVIEKAIKKLYEYIELKTKRLQAVEDQLRGIIILNHRQRALVSHALRHPRQKYTFRSHQISHNVVYQTARTDLIDLENRGLITSEKIGKTWFFTFVDNLEEKLTKLP